MIIVCPLHAVETQIEKHGASHLVSLLGPEHMIDTPAGIERDNHLQLTLHDIALPADGYIAPGETHVGQLIAFFESWDQSAPMVVHCWAGISRSTASAFITMCLLNPQEEEIDLAWELRHLAPSATPNRLIIEHADRLLKRDGRMVSAVKAIGRGVEAWEGDVFTWEVKR